MRFILCSFSQAEADEAASEAQGADEKAKKAMLDAAKIAEELRYEQDNAQGGNSIRFILA